MAALALKLYDKIKISKSKKQVIAIVLVIVISCIAYIPYTINIYEKAQIGVEAQFAEKMDKYIKENTEPEDLVQLIGGSNEAVGANTRTRRLAASKYSYIPLWGTFTIERRQEIVEQAIDEIKINKPKIIFICQYEGSAKKFNELMKDKEGWDNFLNENYNLDEEITKELQVYEVYKRK